MQSFRSRYQRQGFSEDAVELLTASWRDGTQKSYGKYIRMWKDYCDRETIDPVYPPLTSAINFLASLFKTGT